MTEEDAVGKAPKPLPNIPPWPYKEEESGRSKGRVAEALHPHQQWNKIFGNKHLTHDDMLCAAECTKKEHEVVLKMCKKEYAEYLRKRDTG